VTDRIFKQIEGLDRISGMENPERRANTARDYV
jgi:hypothetical protein